MVRRCPRCGEIVGADEIICEFCGADLGLDSEYSWKFDVHDEVEQSDEWY